MAVTNGFPQGSLLDYGTEEQRQGWLPALAKGAWIGAFCLSEPHAGSDAAALRTRADKVADGYVLNGEEARITSGRDADLYLVLARTDTDAGVRGLSCFIIVRGSEGLIPGAAERKMGQLAAVTSTVTFSDCFVPEDQLIGEEGQGFVIAMSQLDAGRINIAAHSVRLAPAACEAALYDSSTRAAFGRTIRYFQGGSFPLADMSVKLEAAGLLTQRAAWLIDQRCCVTRKAAIAKLYASE